MDIGQSSLDPVVIEAESLVIETEQVKERRMQIIDGADVLNGFVAKLVRSAVAEAALHTRAREPDSKS